MAEQASYKEVNEFIRRELEKHGEWLVDRFVEQIEKNGNIITGNLLDTLNYDLYDPGNGSAAGLEVELPVYGRFFEIAGNKRRRKASKMPKNVNRIVWGIRNRPTKRKPTRWYNMNMSSVVANMNRLGYGGEYWVRADGVKMLGDYIIAAANYSVHPRGSLVESSLGTCIVCDTGGFASRDTTMLDIATAW